MPLYNKLVLCMHAPADLSPVDADGLLWPATFLCGPHTSEGKKVI